MLRDTIYTYFWEQIKNKQFVPGEFINLNQLAQQLSVSRTPLREALLVLEAEGFVKILPKKGIYITPLSLVVAHSLYEIIGALESSIIVNNWHKIDNSIIKGLEEINEQMLSCNDFVKHYSLNYDFHFMYVNLSKNEELKRYLSRLYQRVYDFSGINYGEKFQDNNCAGHNTFIQLLGAGEPIGPSNFLRDTHWKFRVPEIFSDNN